MATRMQQRRGTASQWTTANPILAAAEIGFETDTNQFKIGDGVNHWEDLSYFKNLEDLGGSLDDYVLIADLGAPGSAASLDVNGYIPVNQLGNILGDAPQILDTLEELAGALQDADGLVTIKINTKAEAERIVTTSDINTAVIAEQEARDAAIAQAINDSTTEITNAYTGAITEAISNEVNARDAEIAEAINNEVAARDTAITNAIADEVTARDAAITQEINSATGTLEDYADAAALAAQGAAETSAQGYISTHNSDTTNVHGISDTSQLALITDVSAAAANTVVQAADSVNAKIGDVTVDGTSGNTITDRITASVSTHSDDTTNVHGIADTSVLLTTAGGTVDSLTITGNLTVNGTTTTVDTANLEVTDSLIYLSSEQYDSDVLDIGIFAAYGDIEAGHVHTGLVRDASDGKWKLVSNSPEPVANVLDFDLVNYDTLKLGGVEYPDGIQVKQGVPSLTSIVSTTAGNGYSVVLTDRDKLVEVNPDGQPVTVTIPLDSSVAYPVGTSIDILQISSGEVTIAGAQGVTVNATPGLKLRTQWSSATLFKRATDTWVVFGDLSA